MKRFICLILVTIAFLGCHVDSDRGEPIEKKLGGIANPPGTGVSWQEAGITQPPISACDAGSGIPVVSFNAGGQPYCVGVNVQYAEGGGGGGGFPCDSGVQVYDGGTFSCLPYNAGGVSIACDSGVQVFDGGTYSCLPYPSGTAGGGIGPTGTPLTGATNAIPTGNTSKSIDPTSANVGIQLQNGATDGETKNFVIVNSNAHDAVFTSPSDNIISLGNGGVPVGFSTPFKANGRGATITFTWVQAELSGAGAWVTA